jgi:hypothetical protein
MNEDNEMWRQHNEEMRQMRERRRFNFEDIWEQLIKCGHRVKQMSLYQFRVDDVLDVYPSNKRWHDIRINRRGDLRVPFHNIANYIESLIKQNNENIHRTTGQLDGHRQARPSRLL